MKAFSMGAKCDVDNKKDLLGVNGDTYVMMLIVDKTWRNPLKHFCALGIRPFVKKINYLLNGNGCTHAVTLIVKKSSCICNT